VQHLPQTADMQASLASEVMQLPLQRLLATDTACIKDDPGIV